jgi:flagellar motor switch protein FliG
LSELVTIEDLGLLENADLRALFEQVEETSIVEALTGLPSSLRSQLLAKLTPSSAAGWEARLDAKGPVPSEAAESARRVLVETLCRLSRSGQIAFDDPADIVA